MLTIRTMRSWDDRIAVAGAVTGEPNEIITAAGRRSGNSSRKESLEVVENGDMILTFTQGVKQALLWPWSPVDSYHDGGSRHTVETLHRSSWFGSRLNSNDPRMDLTVERKSSNAMQFRGFNVSILKALLFGVVLLTSAHLSWSLRSATGASGGTNAGMRNNPKWCSSTTASRPMPVLVKSSGTSNAPLSIRSDEYHINRIVSEIRGVAELPDVFPSDGIILNNKLSQDAIQALRDPTSCCIGGVPVDSREDARVQLMRSLKRPSANNNNRVKLLCNAGFPGCGKTTLQSFNSHWFVTETKGIAVEITFNDDQDSLVYGHRHHESARSDRLSMTRNQFEVAVAVRIIHRIIMNLTNNIGEADHFVGRDDINHCVHSLKSPLNAACAVMRQVFKAPCATKILLCVDELKKAGDRSLIPIWLSVLSKELDANPTFFLSVSVMGALELGDFSTSSGRQLLFQSLRPLWHNSFGFNSTHLASLPQALQPFFCKNMRLTLPYKPIHRETYSMISIWLFLAGGHARTVRVLFEALREFDGVLDSSLFRHMQDQDKPVNARNAGRKFASALVKWMHQHSSSIHERINSDIPYPMSYRSLYEVLKKRRPDLHNASSVVERAEINRIVETLAADSARYFQLESQEPEVLSMHRATLEGAGLGYCNILRDSGAYIGFIPLASVYRLGEEFVAEGPCGRALDMLAAAVMKYLDPGTDRGKGWEAVVAASLLLYSRSSEFFFNMRSFCEKHGPDMNCKLKGGPSIEYLELDYSFPIELRPYVHLDVTPEHLTNLTKHLAPESIGAVIVPQERYNVAGDIYGLFRDAGDEWVLYIVQCKDHFSAKEGELAEAWRKHKHHFRRTDDKGRIKFANPYTNQTEYMRFRFVLFVSNGLEVVQGTEMRRDEGIATLSHMRKWLPTTAYGAQNAMELKELCSFVDHDNWEGWEDQPGDTIANTKDEGE